MFVFVTLLVCLVTLIIVYLWTVKSRYTYFQQRGIPCPPFCFFFGHFKTIWSIPLKTHQWQQWTRQFGSIYGLYEGSRPIYIVSDADFLQEVFTKQFSSFHSRHLPFVLREASKNKPSLFSAIGATWHRQRQVINPAFTSLKLKLMAPMVHDCVDSLMKKIAEYCEKEEQLDIYTLYKRLTMDVMCHCVFGVDTDIQNDIDNEYFKKAEETVAYNFDKNAMVRLSQLMPSFIPLLGYIMTGQILLERIANKFIRNIEEMPRFWLMKRLKYLIDVRTSSSDKENKKRRVDLLQLMLDVATQNEIMEHTDSDVMSKLIHYDEVSHNMLSLMIAGYETTATTLAYSTYVLAKEPLVQKKLQDEIDNYDENKNEYDQVHNMIYLDWFIREVLRMFPAAPQATTRECNTTTVVCGHTIDEGCVIQPDVLSVHYDPDLWGPEDPNIFLPERHSTPRHPAAFMPFGLGPRNCIGKRFALMEIKMCFARLLRQYSIHPGDKMEEKFELKDTSFILHPKTVYVKIVKRS
ncbi:unnamed protein product [Rotaria sp. Silwood1]|nr:unnamed protein product [Rotaria sp. Silwood1]CAF3810101.1 unnamed protein product [Rotaria sp. Silwood1]CAF3949331.1 unnamed protein product [Rotaria sp. Silwood1]CAF4993272.1 unnamed protein product [Rotaria sp. Silwood1]CAF5005628.1 unnamed protein product [Rotaria sp. Silwood1]